MIECRSEIGVVVLCGSGRYQDYLLNRVHAEFRLLGFARYDPVQPKGSLQERLIKYRNTRSLLEYLFARAYLPGHEFRARQLEHRLLMAENYAGFPEGLPHATVADINDPSVAKLIADLEPDVVIVNGTNLLRRPLLELAKAARLGFVNLHTGLSPYSRGGNCNLFMLLEGKPELVGITVHHLDGGIDRGDIILSSRVPMECDDNFEMVEVREFHHGIEATLRAVHTLAAGQAPRVKQWEEGKLFLRRTGYVYRPYHRVLANRMIKGGLIRDYLADKNRRDAGIRLVECPGVAPMDTSP